MPLVENVLKTLAKSVLVPLGLTAAASTTDAVVQKKNLDREQQHYCFQMKNQMISLKLLNPLMVFIYW